MALMVSLSYLLVACSPSEPAAPRGATLGNLKNVYYTMAVFENDTNKTIGVLLREVPTGTSLQEKWRTLVAARQWGRI